MERGKHPLNGLDEDIRDHIERETQDNVDRGMPLEEARRQAMLKFGNVALVAEDARAVWTWVWFEQLTQDVRYALRTMRRSPGFTAVAVLTLALGVGANAAMFALADAALLRPLPFADPDRLVLVEERDAFRTGSLRSRIAPFNFHDWSQENRTFDVMAAVYVPPGGGGPAMMGTDGTAEIVTNQNVTAQFFDVFGVRPVLGRTFAPADETSGEALAVLSETFWRARLGADPSVVGRALLFDGEPRTVIGIVPAHFQFFRANSVWMLLQKPRDDERGRRLSALRVVGRMKPGVTIEIARADLNRIADRLAQFRDTRPGRRVTVEPFRHELIGPELRSTAMLFLGVVGFVLLVCCANLASLLLARAMGRARELSMRSALGARRWRIVQQLVTESVVLALIGGAAGAVVGATILMAAPSVIPAGLIPGGVTLAFDARVVTFCAAASIVVGVVFGLVPAWQATAAPLAQSIAIDSRTSTARGGRFRSLLVAAQMATAVLLLCGAGLLLRTLVVVSTVDPGYSAPGESLLTMDITVYRSAAPGGSRRTEDAWVPFYQAVEREIAAVPGVRSAAWATTLPMGDSQTGNMSFQIVGDPPAEESNRPRADYQIISPSYFVTVDVPIVAGRALTEDDTARSRQVCVVSEAFVRRYLSGRTSLGTRLKLRRFSANVEVEREIVGIARQVKGRADETAELAQIYVPNTQDPWAESYLLVRVPAGSAEALTPSIRAAIACVDPTLAVRSIKTLGRVTSEGTARYRFRAVLIAAFAGLALLLAMAGVFGVQAYLVQQRWREFGVRLALGASPRSILALVASHAGRLVGAGLLTGLVAAAAVSRTISAFLFGVQPFDAVTFAAVTMVVGLAAVIASAVPAMRAACVDPAVAFRQE
jgi:putative ABC transport system permease protein